MGILAEAAKMARPRERASRTSAKRFALSFVKFFCKFFYMHAY